MDKDEQIRQAFRDEPRMWEKAGKYLKPDYSNRFAKAREKFVELYGRDPESGEIEQILATVFSERLIG